ncbi:hypothetical protein [Myxosarcina sp. GI1]|uniref:hypothetical protein n=1 Tax=Myxosarcina sp. GI1 TaxID=1541065 RepID=UPI00055DE265|nr:hypothetical protein [Myxosarcina sp. GI1]
MANFQRAIGIFQDRADTEAALKKLDASHYSLERVFVIAQDLETEKKIVDTQSCKSLRDRFDTRISSVTPQNSSTASETAIDLTQALIHLDIPVDTARVYNDLVNKGEYLVMIEGNEADISGAETILQDYRVREWVIYEVIREHPEVIVVDRRHHSRTKQQ